MSEIAKVAGSLVGSFVLGCGGLLAVYATYRWVAEREYRQRRKSWQAQWEDVER